MSRCSLKRIGQKPQAGLGMLLLGLGSTALSWYNNRRNADLEVDRQNDAIAENRRLQEQQNALNKAYNNADNINKLFQTEQEYNLHRGDNLIFNAGGKVSLKNTPFKITSGGYAIPLDSHTFLLRGRSHANGGINMTFGTGKNQVKINAQGGEPFEIGKNNAFIYSNSNKMRLSNGLNPAQSLLAGYNRENIKIEQQLKNGNHRSTPVKGNKAELGDWIKLGSSLLSAIGTGAINNKYYNKINTKLSKPEYYEETPVIIDTNTYKGAQLANLERMRSAGNKIIGENTANSQVAQHRMRLNNLDYGLQRNAILDEASKENRDLRNLQTQLNLGVNQRNVANKNQHSRELAEIDRIENELSNNLTLNKLQNADNIIGGSARAIGNFVNQIQQRQQDYNTLRGMMAASNPGTIETFLNNGGTFGAKNDANIYKSLKDKNKTQALNLDEINLMNNLYGRFNPFQRRLYKIG